MIMTVWAMLLVEWVHPCVNELYMTLGAEVSDHPRPTWTPGPPSDTHWIEVECRRYVMREWGMKGKTPGVRGALVVANASLRSRRDALGSSVCTCHCRGWPSPGVSRGEDGPVNRKHDLFGTGR